VPSTVDYATYLYALFGFLPPQDDVQVQVKSALDSIEPPRN